MINILSGLEKRGATKEARDALRLDSHTKQGRLACASHLRSSCGPLKYSRRLFEKKKKEGGSSRGARARYISRPHGKKISRMDGASGSRSETRSHSPPNTLNIRGRFSTEPSREFRVTNTVPLESEFSSLLAQERITVAGDDKERRALFLPHLNIMHGSRGSTEMSQRLQNTVV